MNRIAQFSAVVRRDHTDALPGPNAEDPLLLSMLAHVAYADRHYAEAEFDVLALLMPGRPLGEVLDHMVTEADRPFDFDGLATAYPDAADRRMLVELAAHMLVLDRKVYPAERAFVAALRAHLDG